MPELPDVTVYLEGLEPSSADASCVGVRLASPFLLRTVTPAARGGARPHGRRACGGSASGSSWRSTASSSWSST